jgi:hypothetical protein
VRLAVAPFHGGDAVTFVTVAMTVVMESETPLIRARHWPVAPVVQVAVPRLLPFVRVKRTVTPAPETFAPVLEFLMVTVSAGRQPLPEVSELLLVLLMYERGAAVVVVVVGGAVVVVVGGAVVVVVGGAVVVVGGAVVVVVATVVVGDPPGIEVPVGAAPSVPGRAPMRPLVVS